MSLNRNIMCKKVTLLAILLFAIGQFADGQSFSPTTTWPYAYNDFVDGEVQMAVGKNKTGKYNICLDGNKLHFIEGDLVKEAKSSDVIAVKIGQDFYTNVGGQLLKVVAKSDKALVVEDKEIDFAALNATGGAYGSSSNSVGTMALSSAEGIGGSRTNMNHMELKNNKDGGKILTLIQKYYIVFGQHRVYAAKKDVMDCDGVDKAVLSAFLKENKIKWKDPQSIVLVGDFLAENCK